MQFSEGNICHIYNRGNYKQQVFFNTENYLHFLVLCNKYISPAGDILAWCLMPNHFHFLIHVNEKSLTPIHNSPLPVSTFSFGFRMLLSSYTKAINKSTDRHGNLFQQRTKSKWVNIPGSNYAETAFHYIHQNPLKAGLVDRMEEWQFSSFQDYCNLRNGKLCNKAIAKQKLNINWGDFLKESYAVIDEEAIRDIF